MSAKDAAVNGTKADTSQKVGNQLAYETHMSM